MIADQIKAARLAKGLSVEHVAAKLDLSPGTYQGFELGETVPSPVHLYTLAQLLGVPPEEWLAQAEHTQVYINTNNGEIKEGNNVGHLVNNNDVGAHMRELFRTQQDTLEQMMQTLQAMTAQQNAFFQLMQSTMQKNEGNND